MSPSFANARISVFEFSNVAAEFRRATLALRVSNTLVGEYLYTVISGVISCSHLLSYISCCERGRLTFLLAHS